MLMFLLPRPPVGVLSWNDIGAGPSFHASAHPQVALALQAVHCIPATGVGRVGKCAATFYEAPSRFENLLSSVTSCLKAPQRSAL